MLYMAYLMVVFNILPGSCIPSSYVSSERLQQKRHCESKRVFYAQIVAIGDAQKLMKQ